MASLNKVMLIGNITKDIELKHLPNGTAVANTSIAMNERWTDKNTGEIKEKAEFANIVLWRGSAEFASKYARKGLSVYVEGKLQTRSWEQDGVKKYITEIQASEFKILTPKGYQSQGVAKESTQDNTLTVDDAIDMNDTPF